MNLIALIVIELPANGLALSAVGLVVFAVVTAMMYVIFRMLKKSIKMAIRLAVVAAVLIIAAVGGLSLWWFNSGDTPKQKSVPARKK